ncbi:TorF family putative porin [Solimonas flava]|uniref:TorF family putative porin n=1 Tax=Solimonas flava TaxID=415849 RepID=UPI00042970BA|nr:TorF family putative porin [Solimonas flava]
MHLLTSFPAAAFIAAASLAAPAAATASTATGNVGAFSEYLYRGVEQSNGAAIQGGIDYAHDSGLYIGTWASNTDFAGSQGTVSDEIDVYGGCTHSFGAVTIDVGAYFYYYRDDTSLDTIEYYLGLSAGRFGAKAYYTGDYFGTDEDGFYVTANYALPLGDTLALTPQVGYSVGDGPRAFVVAAFDPEPSDHYLDYSLTLTKTLDDGLSFSLALIGTDLHDDDEKVVVGLKKTFEL